MGTCYTYVLFDECDWSYGDLSKEQTIEAIKKEYPVTEVLAQWRDYIVIDLDKINPYGEAIQPLSKYCEIAHCYPDTAAWKLEKVKFQSYAIGNKKPPL